jgi:gluconate 2-dehydrogenase alpha chain
MQSLTRTDPSDKDAPLRYDIRLLGRILGDTIRLHEGEQAFDLIEAIHQIAIRFHRNADEEARQELQRIISALPIDQATQIIRAFGYCSHLANLAEDQHHIRRVRAHAMAKSPAREGTMAHALAQAKQAGVTREKAAKSLGYHPFPGPSANASQPYVNPDGVAFGACHYCGYCERFGCEVTAKASPHFTVIPLAAKKSNVEMRTNARVLKVNLDGAKRRAESVTYIDASGREFEQPGELVILAAYALGNVHLMLWSGIGRPYDPMTGEGVVGRNYAYQIGGGATVFFDEKTWMNPFMGAGALSMVIDDFNTGSFDHGKEGFIGGGGISTPSATGRPIGFRPVPPGTPAWGTEWKRAVVRHYNHTLAINNQGSVMAYRQNYLDLDPTYRDRYGRPLLRMTFDYHANEQKQANYITDICVKIGQAMGAERVVRRAPPQRYSIVPYQSTHNTGGAVLGTDPKTSALNRFTQSWDVPNVFVTGACAFPQNAGKNLTGPVGALAYWTADAIKRYLKSPGALVPA